jgi:hypothetical protein
MGFQLGHLRFERQPRLTVHRHATCHVVEARQLPFRSVYREINKYFYSIISLNKECTLLYRYCTHFYFLNFFGASYKATG